MKKKIVAFLLKHKWISERDIVLPNGYQFCADLFNYLPSQYYTSHQWTKEERQKWLNAFTALLDVYIDVKEVWK